MKYILKPIIICLLFNSCQRGSEGKRIYSTYCGNCHMDDGKGVARLIPPFKISNFQNNRNLIICNVQMGVIDTSGERVMPAFAQMSDAQIANVLNYIGQMKKANVVFFNETEVSRGRILCKKEKNN